MEPSFPTSFIPKRPIDPTAVADQSVHSHRRFSVASFLTFIIVLATVISYVGTFFYQKTLTIQVQQSKDALAKARDGIGTDFVTDMKRLDDRITSIKTLLAQHIVVTPIFQALEATTLHSVQYKNLTYSFDPTSTTGKDVSVTLDGATKNYASLALQSDAFLGNALIKNPIFSNLTIDDKLHIVNFKLAFSVDRDALSYERFIASLSATSTPQVSIPQTITGSTLQ